MSAFLGVDPGLNGALAVVDGAGEVVVADMPTYEIKGKQRLDVQQLHAIVGQMAALLEPRLAVVEDVHSMPKQGVASSFSFGFVTGALHAVLAAHKIPMHLVSPAAWKRLMGLSADKDASRQRASRLFPKGAHLWARKKDDGRAEAALLAYYGSRIQ